MSAQPLVSTSAAHPWVRPKTQLGNPSPLACTLAKVTAEAVVGGETLQSIYRWVSPEARQRLEKQRSLARRAGRTPVIAHVQRIRVERVSEDAAEAAVIVEIAGRSRAVAIRLETVHGRWLATHIDVL